MNARALLAVVVVVVVFLAGCTFEVPVAEHDLNKVSNCTYLASGERFSVLTSNVRVRQGIGVDGTVEAVDTAGVYRKMSLTEAQLAWRCSVVPITTKE